MIVVSRYNENIEWTKQFPNILIYNKGEPISDDYNHICLPNVGREGHTIYTYIYNNYENLDEYTIFLQGDPFDHQKNIIEKIKNYLQMGIKLDIDFEYLSDEIFTVNFSDDTIFDDTVKDDLKPIIIPIRLVYNHLFNVYQLYDFRYTFGVGGQFIVSKRAILSRPREFYRKIVKILEYTKSPGEGYVIERFHQLFFTGHEPK